MIVQILVPQTDAQHALLHQRLHAVLDAPWIAVVRKTPAQTLQYPDPFLQLPQRQPAAVRRNLAAIENTHHRALPKTSNSSCDALHSVPIRPRLRCP